MRSGSIILAPLLVPLTVMARPPPRAADCDASSKPPAFFLAGDSTVAVDGGWGDGFLTYPREGAWGINFGHSGATTVSFKADGDWANLTSHVEESVAEYDVYVTIQFGHNDQKEEKGISHAEFEANLEAMATEIQELGATPILISSLTRRTFESDNNVAQSLEIERLIAIVAAAETGSAYLDLNRASTDYVNAIGEGASHEYNYEEGDNTHLNEHGGVVFGRMVADLLLRREECLGQYITPDEELSDKIWSGLPA
ncbi:hypothetical protein ACO1O0_005228 [Amphichorda felina]